jgi:hypothetical protein
MRAFLTDHQGIQVTSIGGVFAGTVSRFQFTGARQLPSNNLTMPEHS